MEERRRLRLCFSCNEKFGRGHNKVYQRLFLLELGDEEYDEAEAFGKPKGDNDPLSLHVIAGVRTSCCCISLL